MVMIDDKIREIVTEIKLEEAKICQITVSTKLEEAKAEVSIAT